MIDLELYYFIHEMGSCKEKHYLRTVDRGFSFLSGSIKEIAAGLASNLLFFGEERIYSEIIIYSTGSREVPSRESLKNLPSLILSEDISKINKVPLRNPLRNLRKNVIHFLKDPEGILNS